MLALDPRRPGVHFRLGRVLLSRSQRATSDSGDEAEALKEFQQELELDPTHANAAYEIGEIHRKAGRLDNAREYFETALKHYPEFEEALVGLGRTLIALGKPELAVAHLQKAIALNAASEVAYYQLAQAYRALGDTAAQEKALAVFEQLQSAASRAGRRGAPVPSRGDGADARYEAAAKASSMRQSSANGPADLAMLLSWPRALASPVVALSIASRHRRRAARVVFTDVTRASGITFTHAFAPDKKYILESMSGGVALIDFDRDGRLDIYLVNAPTVATAGDPRSARSELWRNNGDGTYADVTAKAGVGYPGWGMGVAAGDYDNDGWDDLYVTCFGPDRLFRNQGDGTFADVTQKAGVSDPRWSTGAAFGDYDNDGWLDLFVANYVDIRLDALPEFGQGKTCQFQGLAVQCGPKGLPGSGDSLFRNNGDGTFTDVSVKAGVSDAPGRYGMGVAWCDFNEDGRVDLYVANDTGRELSLPEQRQRHLHGRGARVGHGPQRKRRGAGLDGGHDRGLRPPRPLEHPGHEFLRRIQRVLPARQGLPLHGRVVRVADREGEPPVRRVGHGLLRLRQRRMAGSARRQRSRVPASGPCRAQHRLPSAEAALPEQARRHVLRNRPGRPGRR